jgi:hypothetical protein
MRKLGKGQSLVFCIPEEINTKILRLKGCIDSSLITVADVLSWSISETFVEHRRNMPLWAVQGRRYVGQTKIWEAAKEDNRILLSKESAMGFLENESQTLDHRYRPRATQSGQSTWDIQDENIGRILERCHQFNSLSPESAALEEEQERQLSPEIEEEQQVKKPAPAKALKHSLHKDVLALATTGKIIMRSEALLPAFQTLQNTTAAEYLKDSQSSFPGDLLVTADFSRTIKPMGVKFVTDNYLRPVQWILTCTNAAGLVDCMVVISPFEAQMLLPTVRKHKKVTLHYYLPRPNLQFRALDSLDLYTEGRPFDPSTVPYPLIIQLNLFAGQLYFGSFEQYTATCDFLGLAWKLQEHGGSVEVAADGFIVKGNTSGFATSPVKFLYVLMTKIRRSCDSIEKTHMGRVLNGTLLEKGEFEKE